MKHTIIGKVTGIYDESREDVIGLTVATGPTSHGFAVPLDEAAGMQLRDAVYITLSDTFETGPVPHAFEEAVGRLRHAHLVLIEAAENYESFDGDPRADRPRQESARQEYLAATEEFLTALSALTGVEDASHAAVDSF